MNFLAVECTWDVDDCYTEFQLSPIESHPHILILSTKETEGSITLNEISMRLFPHQQERLFEYLRKVLNK